MTALHRTRRSRAPPHGVCCATQLADLIRQKIDAAFEEHVDMEEVQERFLDVIALALKVVVRSEAQRGCTLATMLTWSLLCGVVGCRRMGSPALSTRNLRA